MKILNFLGIQPNHRTCEKPVFANKSQSLSIYSEVLIFINGVQTINLSAFDCLKTDCISSKEFGTEKVAFTCLQRSSAWSKIAFPRERLFRAQKCNDVRCILNSLIFKNSLQAAACRTLLMFGCAPYGMGHTLS